MFSCYFSPNRSREDLEKSLDSLRDSVRRVGGRSHLVLGDFNAWSTQWGSSITNARGGVLGGGRSPRVEREVRVDLRPSPR